MTTNQLERTNFGNWLNVILTEGMHVAGTGRIYGVFHDESDARSEDADSLALATVGADSLTAGQIELARRNSEAL